MVMIGSRPAPCTWGLFGTSIAGTVLSLPPRVTGLDGAESTLFSQQIDCFRKNRVGIAKCESRCFWRGLAEREGLERFSHRFLELPEPTTLRRLQFGEKLIGGFRLRGAEVRFDRLDLLAQLAIV